ncbi:MAG: SPOR domain-containing protein [Legionellaceae bacterium]|nr:SPOR domain-containing protein [Legionellaceae bacterium]
MATKYGKKNMGRRSSNGIGSLMFAFVAFIFGYLLATAFDINQLSGWVNTHILAKAPSSPTRPVVQQAEVPKPKFEFYTLLAKGQNGQPPVELAPSSQSQVAAVNAPQQVAVVPAASTVVPIDLTVTQKLPLHEPLIANGQQPKSAPVIAGERYMIQVGSFKNVREAEKMKISLVMKGFDVNISTTNQQQMNWYRVIIGPFRSRSDAQKAQLAVARSEHIMGMIRKMDA